MILNKITAKIVFHYTFLAIFILCGIILAIFTINSDFIYFSSIPWTLAFFFLIITLFLSHSNQIRSIKSSLILLIWTFLFTLFMEIIGSHYGIPFGKYFYTQNIPLRIIDVPLYVPITWYIIIYSSLQVSYIIFPFRFEELEGIKKWRINFVISILTALATTAWDLILDPIAVVRMNWIWEGGGPYYNVPLSNYLGWFAVAFIICFVFLSLFENRKDTELTWDIEWFPVISYFGLFLLMVIRALPLGRPEFILIGFMAMVPYIFISSTRLLWDIK